MATSAPSEGISRPVWRVEWVALAVVLGIGLLFRVHQLNAPHLAGWWMREMQNHSIAINYLENGIDLLWPEADFTPDRRNFVGQDLPLMSALAAIGWKLFGVHEWVPRLIAIGFALVSIVLLYAILRRFLPPEGAVVACLFFTVAPINSFVTRSFMAESLTICFSLAAMLLFMLFVETNRGRFLAPAAVAAIIVVVSKPPVAHVAVPMLWYLWHRRGPRGLLDLRVGAFAAIVLGALALYIHHVNAVRAEYFGVSMGLKQGLWFSWVPLTSPKTWSLFAFRFTKQVLTPFGIVGSLIAVPLIRRREPAWFLTAWLIGTLVYFIVVLGGNADQAYYQIWFVAPCAGLLGYAWQAIRDNIPSSKRLRPLVAIGLLVSCAWGAESLYEPEPHILEAAAALDQVVPDDSLIIVYPAGLNCLYYLDRDGWCGRDADPVEGWQAPGNPGYIVDRMERGAEYCLIFTEELFSEDRDLVVEGWLDREMPRVHHAEWFDIYRLEPSHPPQ